MDIVDTIACSLHDWLPNLSIQLDAVWQRNTKAVLFVASITKQIAALSCGNGLDLLSSQGSLASSGRCFSRTLVVSKMPTPKPCFVQLSDMQQRKQEKCLRYMQATVWSSRP